MALLTRGYELHHSGARGVFPWTESTGTRVVELLKSSKVPGGLTDHALQQEPTHAAAMRFVQRIRNLRT